MKKKVVLLLTVALMSIMAVACGTKTCKTKGCSKDVYKDKLCNEHYLEKTIEDGLKELEGLFN